MTIQLAIDDALINVVCVLGHFETQEDAVINALREFINHRKQQEIKGPHFVHRDPKNRAEERA